MSRKIIFICTMAIAVSSAYARIINVPAEYTTIQAGIDASANGETVLVQPGSYSRINFNQHAIVVASRFLTTGDTLYKAWTIINGTSWSPAVVMTGIADSGAAIIGFTIQGGHGSSGGGIYCRYSSVRIENNIIKNNTAFGIGGGIYCGNGRNHVSNNLLFQNISESWGGGIYVSQEAEIIKNDIFDNRADDGAGMYINSSDAIIDSNSISLNESLRRGGGIFNHGSSQIINNLINENTADVIGGGIFIQVNSSPFIAGNIIDGNWALEEGGGIYVETGSSAQISSNYIANNWSISGGGISTKSDIEISRNYFDYNFAPFGAAIYCILSSPIILGNKIFGNNASMRGAGIYCAEFSGANISGNFIYQNYGQGVCCYFASPTLFNNVVIDNVSPFGGGLSTFESNPVVFNTMFWGNGTPLDPQIFVDGEIAPVISFCNIQDSLWPGDGNISVDPLFRDPANGDFHLMSTACGDSVDSPCIDAGRPDILDSILDCDWGLGTSRSDMGAYGGGDYSQVGIEDGTPQIPERFILFQNYPNPFNAQTHISYELPAEANITIEIFDILGRKIATLVNTNQQAGPHAVIWESKDAASGVYLYKIQAGEYSEIKKCVLMR